MRILIVDDEPAVLKGLSALIDWAFLQIDEVILCENGVVALESIHHQMPDLLITDVNMPVVSGLDLVKTIREMGSNLPIVILSGYDEFEYAREAINYHVEAYLLKPVDEDELTLILKNLVQQLKANHKEPSMPYEQFHEDSMTYKVLYYLHHHYKEPIKLKSMAQLFHLTPAYLGQIIKKNTGKLFNDYLMVIRMNAAIQLLETTDMMVYEVGLEVGYKDTDYFIKKFTTYTDLSPKTYKKQHELGK